MEEKIKKYAISALLAIFCGFIAGNLYLRFYGYISAYLTEINAVAWIKIFPVKFRGTAYLFHCFFFEILVLALVITIIGCIIGAYLEIGRFKAAAISFICFLFTKVFYHYQVWNEFFSMNPSIIYFAFISIITFLFFGFSFYLGSLLRKKIC